MRKILALLLLVAVGLAGGTYYFAKKADKIAPEKATIREEATNVGPF